MAGCVLSFMLAQKYGLIISEIWPKLTFLLKQQTKFVLNELDAFIRFPVKLLVKSRKGWIFPERLVITVLGPGQRY